MSELKEYNVEGSLIGLGEFILLEIASESIDLDDVQQLVYIPISITVPSGSYSKKKDEFTYTSTNFEYKTFPIDQIITKGVYKCEFKNNKNACAFGVMKSGLVIPFGFGCGTPQYCKDTAYQYKDGMIKQNGKETKGNQTLKLIDTFAIEVNMSPPRTATFFIDGKQQPVFVSNLPESVQIFFYLSIKDDSITVLSLKRLESPTATNIADAKE
ncbi:MAG: hypothetical protein EZS28_049757, partial [Streblomastix strix]